MVDSDYRKYVHDYMRKRMSLQRESSGCGTNSCSAGEGTAASSKTCQGGSCSSSESTSGLSSSRSASNGAGAKTVNKYEDDGFQYLSNIQNLINSVMSSSLMSGIYSPEIIKGTITAITPTSICVAPMKITGCTDNTERMIEAVQTVKLWLAIIISQLILQGAIEKAKKITGLLSMGTEVD